MSKIVIKFTANHSYRKMFKILHRNIKISTVVVTFDHPSEFLKICVDFGSQLSKLVLKEVCFNNGCDFIELLKSLPNLETLEILKLRFLDYEKLYVYNLRYLQEPIVMNNLKSLSFVFNEENLVVFCFFIAPNVKEMSVKIVPLIKAFDRWSTNVYGRDSFMRQLRAAEKLVSLNIFEVIGHIFLLKCNAQECTDFRFNLKQFKITSHLSRYYGLAYEDKVLLQNFLVSQSQSLQNLECDMNGSAAESASIMEVIFSQLKCLKKLKFNATLLPKEQDFYHHLELPDSLIELEVSNSFPNEFAMNSILENLPNLEVLKAVDDEHIPTIVTLIAMKNYKLEQLHVMKLNRESCVKFSSLKFLHVEFPCDFKFVQEFLLLNPLISILSIKLDDNTNVGAVFDCLKDRTNISYLKCEGNYRILKALFEKFRADHKSLHSIELNVKKEEKSEHFYLLNNKALPIKTIIFPTDKSKRDINCKFPKGLPESRRIEITHLLIIEDPYF